MAVVGTSALGLGRPPDKVLWYSVLFSVRETSANWRDDGIQFSSTSKISALGESSKLPPPSWL